jgi:hypothetical protein
MAKTFILSGSRANPGCASAFPIRLIKELNPHQRRSHNPDSFIAINITAPKIQQHIPGISHHG